MKTELRVTKYNPKFRDESGAYRKNEWICITDIGNVFEDGVLTQSEYLTTESKYIEAVKSFFAYLKIQEVVVTSLESYRKENEVEDFILSTHSLVSTYKKVTNGAIFKMEEADDLIRLNLRGLIWFKLTSPDSTAEVEFGYDYYMYFLTEADCKSQIVSIVSAIGLYPE